MIRSRQNFEDLLRRTTDRIRENVVGARQMPDTIYWISNEIRSFLFELGRQGNLRSPLDRSELTPVEAFELVQVLPTMDGNVVINVAELVNRLYGDPLNIPPIQDGLRQFTDLLERQQGIMGGLMIPPGILESVLTKIGGNDGSEYFRGDPKLVEFVKKLAEVGTKEATETSATNIGCYGRKLDLGE